MRTCVLAVAVSVLALSVGVRRSEAAGDADLIQGGLPGTSFNANFRQWSGYLNAGNNGKWKFFYWLVESQTGNSANDPLIVWFNGGPGCSSVGGMFEELGPFYVYKDGQTLYENVYAWNKYANVLAIESPIGVGFSYNSDDPKNYTVGDDLTAQQNMAALADFFTNVQPTFKSRRWIITGESYAGIYIPSVTQKILTAISQNQFPNTNFGGIAIGNGYMNIKMLTNALVLWFNYHGMIGVRDWDVLKATCCGLNTDTDKCDFSAQFNYVYMNGSTGDCGNMVMKILNVDENYVDPYNVYQDCYRQNYLTNTRKFIRKGLLPIRVSNGQVADNLNYDSTDNQKAFPCYNGDSAATYLNRPEVQKAFHIADDWTKAGLRWHGCNDDLNVNYPVMYNDTSTLFNQIIQMATDPKGYVQNFNILIYNGDVDTACNFLGDAWHMDAIAKANNIAIKPRMPWVFRNQYAGYHQPYVLQYNNGKSILNMDVLTVKGSGHFVPNDRQGPSLQMITNFLRQTGNYSGTKDMNMVPKPDDFPPTAPNGVSTTPLGTASTPAPSGGVSVRSWSCWTACLVCIFGFVAALY